MMNDYFNNEAANNNNNSNNGGFIMTQGTLTTMEIFADTVKTAMEAYYGDDYKVTVQNVNKNNGLILTGITILKNDSNIAPTIYLNQAYEQYQEGRTLADICKEVIHIHEKYKVQKNFDISCVTNFSKVKSSICYKLINAQKNEALLKDVPHVFIEDLAVIYYILVSSNAEETGTITVKNNMMELWNVTTDDLYELALANTQRLFRGSVQSMANVMIDILSKELDDKAAMEFYDMMVDVDDMVPMYVCTNTMKSNGAGVILYDGLLREFANRVDSDVFILPSSIHETLLIPVSAGMDIEFLKNMVRDINKTEVAPDEILSDNVYYFNRLLDRVELA